MSWAYKFHNQLGLYFVTFATVGWIDVFTRNCYRNILLDSIKYCQANKGLELFAWCMMTNHVHLICRTKQGYLLPDVVRDFKKHTSKEIIKAIQSNESESRREWMLAIFKSSGAYNSNNKDFQFWRQDNKPIELWSNEVIDQKLHYVHQNPVEAGFVQEAHHWNYSSAIDYSGGKGFLEIIYL